MMELSIWEKESFFAPQDIVIIGSGFAGLWAALKLTELQPTKKITILERGLIPSGASTRNAGFSCFGSPSELLHDIEAMGVEKTLELVAMRYNGLLEIRKYFDDETVGYDPSGGYECFVESDTDWQLCREKLAWLNEQIAPITSSTNTFTIADEKLATFGFKGFHHLIENRLEGGLHSGKLVQALLQKIQTAGVQVLTGVEVIGYEKQHSCLTVNTRQGFKINTAQLLLCTNAFTKQLAPQLDIIPNRGQVLVTDELTNCNFRGTFHFDQGYYYFRNLGNRLLIGGARNKSFGQENTTSFDTTAIIQTELERFVQTHLLPGITFNITDRWSGIMAMGTAKLPLVQELEAGVFCCVRMSGMGVALAPTVAGRVASLMSGL